MIIYTNGDSFTDGVGLGDATIFPEYPGDQPTFNLNTCLAWSKARNMLVKDRNLTEKLHIEDRKYCWPTCLGKLVGAEIINNAVGGSNIFSILARTIHDLEKLEKENKLPDYVIIGLTSEERIPIISDNKLGTIRNWVHTAHPNHIDVLSKQYQNYAKEFWKSHSDDEMLIFFLYECLHLKHYVNYKTGKDPIFLNTSNVFCNYSDIVKNTQLPLLEEVWNLLDFETLSHRPSFVTIGKPLGNTACGHWTKKANIKFAKFIAKTYLNAVDIAD